MVEPTAFNELYVGKSFLESITFGHITFALYTVGPFYNVFRGHKGCMSILRYPTLTKLLYFMTYSCHVIPVLCVYDYLLKDVYNDIKKVWFCNYFIFFTCIWSLFISKVWNLDIQPLCSIQSICSSNTNRFL